MSVVNVLPNGFLVITVSPREASQVMDQLLEPSEFPWQSSESQIVALELKTQLKNVLQTMHARELQAMTQFIPQAPQPPQPPADDDIS